MRKHRYVLAIWLLAPAIASAQAVPVPAPGVAPAPQVVRAGDSQLGCPALIAEMDGISQQIQAISERSVANAERARAAATRAPPPVVNPAQTLAGLAAGFIPGAGLALGAMQTAAAVGRPVDPAPNAEMQAMAADAASMMALIPASQRFEHLSALARTKGC